MLHRSFKLNDKGRDFVIGDLHGCFDMLQESMEEVKFDKSKDRMFSVGDLVDRGPKNMECLKLIEEDWFYPVKGNHEDLMICAVVDKNGDDIWWFNGGKWAYDETKVDPEEVLRLATISADLPLAMTIETSYGKIGMCHANPPKDWDSITEGMGRSEKYSLIWSRKKIQHSRNEMQHVKNIDYTVHGHTPCKYPCAVGNSLFIDTGACFKGETLLDGTVLDGNLTCINLEDIPKLCEEYSWLKLRKMLKLKGEDLFG